VEFDRHALGTGSRMRGRPLLPAVGLGSFGAALVLMLAPSALASTATVDDETGILSYAAVAGEANVVTVG
jgi:hypothetical protein